MEQKFEKRFGINIPHPVGFADENDSEKVMIDIWATYDKNTNTTLLTIYNNDISVNWYTEKFAKEFELTVLEIAPLISCTKNHNDGVFVENYEFENMDLDGVEQLIKIVTWKQNQEVAQNLLEKEDKLNFIDFVETENVKEQKQNKSKTNNVFVR